MVAMWLSAALLTINVARWGELADLGVGLQTAHNLVLEAASNVSASRGRAGGPVGIQTSKSAGGVSVSYDTSSSTEQGAGHWNQTTYGTRYYRMAKMMGAGGVQLGADASIDSVSAWSGPLMLP